MDGQIEERKASLRTGLIAQTHPPNLKYPDLLGKSGVTLTQPTSESG